jgi:hypothetical protein
MPVAQLAAVAFLHRRACPGPHLRTGLWVLDRRQPRCGQRHQPPHHLPPLPGPGGPGCRGGQADASWTPDGARRAVPRTRNRRPLRTLSPPRARLLATAITHKWRPRLMQAVVDFVLEPRHRPSRSHRGDKSGWARRSIGRSPPSSMASSWRILGLIDFASKRARAGARRRHLAPPAARPPTATGLHQPRQDPASLTGQRRTRELGACGDRWPWCRTEAPHR